jgi:ketosteroid isomerase-like protein
MPRQNVKVATQAIDAFNETDVHAFAALTTPDFEWSPSMVAVEGEIFRGRDGIDRYFGSLAEAWEKFHIHRDGFRGSGDLVVMLGRLEARGKAAASRSMRRWGWSSIFAPGRSPASAASRPRSSSRRRRAAGVGDDEGNGLVGGPDGEVALRGALADCAPPFAVARARNS